MTVGTNIVVPVVLWGKNAPTHCISSVLMTSDMKNIVTGCNDAQLCVWDLSQDWDIYPRYMLFGHTAAITCIAPGSGQKENSFIVSAAENGEMCLWNLSDGRCIESTKMSYTHSSMQSYHFRGTSDVRLVCNGYYPEILIIDPMTFEIVYTLSSKVAPDWISACCVLRPTKREDDVIVAISNSGAVKVWALTGNESRAKPVHEDESKQVRCLNAQTLTCCPYNQRTVLIVCSKYWQVYSFAAPQFRWEGHDKRIYDAGDFTLLCSESNRCGERWAGGDFISVDRVLVWSTEGKGYLYKLPTNANSESENYHQRSPSAPHAYYILDFHSEKSLACSPAMILHSQDRNDSQCRKLLVRGDSEGQVVIWTLPEVTERQMTLVRQESFDRLPALPPKCFSTLQDVWDRLAQSPAGFLDDLREINPSIQTTSTVYIPSQGKLACGRSDGSIVIVPATSCITLQLLQDKEMSPDKIHPLTLQGHDGRVTCLLYPFNESTRYEPRYLLSGGADFSVCLWDIYEGVKIHTFTVHGGEISQLLVPPNNCNMRILTSICSVAADHSVSLLSLRERKCIMLASRHLFPVESIRWRPLDDFMVVSCTDGTVYVWQMETGHLDRVVHGLTAEEILNNCDENAMPIDQLVNPNLTLAQAFKRRNLATFKNLAQQKLHSLSQNQQTSGAKLDLSQPQDYPMYIEGIRTNSRDPDSHVIFFDTEALIVQLLTEEFATMSPGELEAKGLSNLLPDRVRQSAESMDAQAKIAGIIAKVKDTADSVGHKIQASVDSNCAGATPTSSHMTSASQNQSAQYSPSLRKKNPPDSLSIKHSNLTMEIAQLFMSMLHAFGLDPDLDRLCLNKLGLLRPKCPISFGLISREGHMALLLPGWHKGVINKFDLSSRLATSGKTKVTLQAQPRSISVTGEVKVGEDRASSVEQSSSGSGTPTSSQNIDQETVDFTTRARWQISSAVTTQHLISVISVANTLMSMNHATFKAPRTARRRSVKPYPSILVQEGDGSSAGSEDEGGDMQMMQQSQIKQGWSLLAALHCVLLPELVGPRNYFSPQLEMLARRWQDRCLEIREAAQALLLAELRRLGPEGRKVILDDWSPFLPTYVDQRLSILNTENQSTPGEEEDEDDLDQVLGGDSPLHKPSRSFESRRKQATAIVMLAVIGAEFGHEVPPNRRGTEELKKGKKGQEGFTLANYSLARHTSRALTFLLQQPPSRKLPAHTPIRRAAIDLIGRGFTVWEPYLDVSAVLLGLLDLCIGAEKLVPSVTFGLPLNPAADACRTSRHALSLIATARPSVFIITMAKEVARYNAMAMNTQSQHHTTPHSQTLVKAKPEILRVIELLVDKMPNDVADQLVEAMDIIIHCHDLGQLKTKGLQELFPAICRFSMVTCCPNTKRIWVGARSGGVAFYELKQTGKCQMIGAHDGQVIAVSVSSDGKFLATFSHKDQKLKFWQTASTNIFGLGSQTTKCIRQIATQPIKVLPHTNLLKLVRLVWTDVRIVVLLTVDGTEQKYYV